MAENTNTSTSPLLTAVEQTFSRMGWECRRVPGHAVVEADFELHHTRTRLHVQVFPPLNAVSVVAQGSNVVPDSRAGLVSEMLMRTNRELTVGNFELDYDTGTVLFRATNLFGSGPVPGEIIASLVHSALAEMDRITPFLTLILRMESQELGTLNLKLFLQREDLLPPVPEDADSLP